MSTGIRDKQIVVYPYDGILVSLKKLGNPAIRWTNLEIHLM
jgi:hypothetical protein